MPLAVHRALRQMRYRHHLMVRRNGAQPLANRAPHLAADVGVDLVEDKNGNLVMRGDNGLHRQHHACDLARGGDLPERTRRLARIRRELEVHHVAAA